MTLETLLQETIERGASDLHLRVGTPPVVRVEGRLRRLDRDALPPDTLEGFVNELLDPPLHTQFDATGSVDFAFTSGDDRRWRASLFRERSSPGMVLRLIPHQIRGLEELGLTKIAPGLCEQKRGLILFSGSAGSGKTTTAASFLQYINHNEFRHLITIEDPIEYVLKHRRSLVTQREVGRDVEGFQSGIRSALRSDPDVLFVGELRDLETMSAAITASETGHLVLATIHTRSAAETIHRLIHGFPSDQQNQIRTQLSSVLSAVFSQRLVPRRDRPGRIAVFEIMTATPGIRNLIRQSSEHKMKTFLQTGREQGMQTFDQHLHQLLENGKITRETAMAEARDPQSLSRRMESS